MLLADVLRDGFDRFALWIRMNLLNISNVVLLVSPLVCLFVGMYATYQRGGAYEIGGELAIPLLLPVIAFVLRAIGNKTGNGTDCPVPYERFTAVSDDGDEVTVPISRQQEMILYLAAVEDYLERSGRL